MSSVLLHVLSLSGITTKPFVCDPISLLLMPAAHLRYELKQKYFTHGATDLLIVQKMSSFVDMSQKYLKVSHRLV